MSDFLSPKSVAIIGASADETKLGGMLLKNMIDAGFEIGRASCRERV